ncbi:MAG: ribonuclease HII, partial [Minisyncoccia bacterium]
ALGDARFVVEFESAEAIDSDGIAVAVRRALARGVNALAEECGHQVSTGLLTPGVHILLDGALRAPPEYSQETIVHGDALVPLISFASIAAKVERDRLMCSLAKEYPEYDFEVHKGYGTKAHYEKLLKHGLCAIHRRSFIHLDGISK